MPSPELKAVFYFGFDQASIHLQYTASSLLYSSQLDRTCHSYKTVYLQNSTLLCNKVIWVNVSELTHACSVNKKPSAVQWAEIEFIFLLPILTDKWTGSTSEGNFQLSRSLWLPSWQWNVLTSEFVLTRRKSKSRYCSLLNIKRKIMFH